MKNLQDQSPKILVIGDLIIDHYIWGSCNRISPEAPVPIVSVANETTVLGGCGNVVNNLKALGAAVSIISVIGDCEAGVELKKLLTDINVSCQYIVAEKDRITSKKTRIITSGQHVVRYDKETPHAISTRSQHIIFNHFNEIVDYYDIILLSDYAKGVLTNELTQLFISSANKKNKKILVDPKGSDYLKYKGAYLLTPNKDEASIATQININDDESLTQAIIKLKTTCDLQISLITLGNSGIAVYDETMHTYPTVAREVFDVTGAGDTVLASLGFALACDASINDAALFANLAAGVVVGKVGSASATFNEIIEHQSIIDEYNSSKYIKTASEIAALSKTLRENGNKIVFTNGCFDLLHIGHIKYLESAKKFGDVLIVGINSDESVSTLKGSSRPINPQHDRAYLLGALEIIDYVVIFDEETPYNLIQAIKPHVLVKGSDYKDKEIIGKDIVDDLKLIEFVNGKSTTHIINKIKQNK